MSRTVKVAFASCRPELVGPFAERFSAIAPEQELWVVSEFPPPLGRWIPYRIDRSLADNEARLKAALGGARIGFAAVVLQPGAPYRLLRWMGWRSAPFHTLFYNSHLDHWTLRPASVPNMLRHFRWRMREILAFQLRPGGDLYTWAWRLRHPRELRRPLSYIAAARKGKAAARARQLLPKRQPAVVPAGSLPAGISIVIPSRDGRELLAQVLPRIADAADEIIVVDNGSTDGTENWLRQEWPAVCVRAFPNALSFARAVNTGVAAVRYSHVCLLNNDMEPEADFLPALRRGFDCVPDLFCATAQIFFPVGKRREETGKAVMLPLPQQRGHTDFPVYCADPLPGEEHSWVLYGSGGCSLYDTNKLRALGGFSEAYVPAYVEDLDLGVRGWQHGWPTVFVAGARTIHHHRATTSRFYDEAELARVLERNYLRFLAATVASPDLFAQLWRNAIDRLNLRAALANDQAAADVLAEAQAIAASGKLPVAPVIPETEIFALGSGEIAVFPGRAKRGVCGKIVIATCYLPFPMAHGGAVRMYNLMHRAAPDWSQVLVSFVDELAPPASELLDICAEVILVRRVGSHARPDRGRPDVVEDFDSPAFAGALRQALKKWAPDLVQLEFTQMAQYAGLCGRTPTLLVEHDVTLDLYAQLLRTADDYDLRSQLERWELFERKAWNEVTCVVAMSEKDRRAIQPARQVAVLPNGVDPVRFSPAGSAPEPGRLLFIGSFAHLPNLLAVDFFLREVWPALEEHAPVLHIIAGSRFEYHFERAKGRVSFRLDAPRLEVEGFISDVRSAYRRASVVIAPLLASAGTNIKIMEAMAMGKAIVSTPGGINGLDELTPGGDLLVEADPAAFARAIIGLFNDPAERRRLEQNGRRTAERVYAWDAIASRQHQLYRELTGRA